MNYTETYKGISTVLEQYLSALNVQIIIQNSLRETGLSPDTLAPKDVPTILQKLKYAASLFLSEEDLSVLCEEILRHSKCETSAK